MLHIKRSKAKGKTYLYFRTGQKGSDGREILVRLPSAKDPGFGAAYASLLGARTKREKPDGRVSTLTVSQLCDLYEQSQHFRSRSAGTQRIYSISLAYFRRMMPTAPAGQVERQDIVRMVDGRAEQPGAANSLLRSVSALYRWGRERGHVTNNPCSDIKELEVGEHEPWPDHVLEAALRCDDDRIRLAVHVLLYTGQRIGDVLKMKWDDLRTDNVGHQWVKVVQQKTGKPLEILVHDALAAELAKREWRRGYIIAGVRGRPRCQKSLRESLQAFGAQHGARVVPHGLRKNAVNALLEALCSVPEVAAITGQTMQVVEHYAKRRNQIKLGASGILKWQGAGK